MREVKRVAERGTRREIERGREGKREKWRERERAGVGQKARNRERERKRGIDTKRASDRSCTTKYTNIFVTDIKLC